MSSGLLRWLTVGRCPTVVGCPRHLASHVESGLQRARWLAVAGLVLWAIDLPVTLSVSYAFAWGFPGLVVLAHVVALVPLAVFLYLTRGEITLRQGTRASMLGAAGVILCAATLVGLSHLRPELLSILSLSLLVVLVVLPLAIHQLVLLLSVGLVTTAAFAAGGRTEADGLFRFGELVVLFTPLCAGVLGIVLNAWQYQSFRAKWKAEALAGRRTRQLARQKGEIERLLISVLPAPVADELRTTGSFAPVVAEVCVVACDIVDFSRYCETLPATLVVEELQRFFRSFDECCIPRGLEPLRAQGDGVLAIGGLWHGMEKQKHRLAIDAILAMLAFRERLALPQRPAAPVGEPPRLLWSARVGVHVGPVIMGVMEGVRLTFDVWGETVNVASRLEQAAPTNSILVSSSVLWATRGLFAYGPIRKCQVKETTISGAAEVTGILPEFRGADGQPNDAFWKVYGQDGYPVVIPDPAGSLRA